MSEIGHSVFYDHSKMEFFIFKTKTLNYFITNDVKVDGKKRVLLITSLADETYKLLHSLCVPTEPETMEFKDFLLLETHFAPVKSYFFARKKFYQTLQSTKEPIRQFAARLHNLADECDFRTELNLVLRDVFVMGIQDKKIRERLQEEDATHKEFVFKPGTKSVCYK